MTLIGTKIVSPQKWPNNKDLASFTKVKPTSRIRLEVFFQFGFDGHQAIQHFLQTGINERKRFVFFQIYIFCANYLIFFIIN